MKNNGKNNEFVLFFFLQQQKKTCKHERLSTIFEKCKAH